MKRPPDKKHRHRVNTESGTQWLSKAETKQLLAAVFAPTDSRNGQSVSRRSKSDAASFKPNK